MAEPKMLTAEELAAAINDISAKIGRPSRALDSLLDHCSMLYVEIAKLRAAVMAADRLLIFAESGQDGDVCNICCARTDGPHIEDCDVPAYRTARAAITLPGDTP